MRHLAVQMMLLAAVLGLTYSAVFAADEDTGKRVDNARVDRYEVPPSAEIQPVPTHQR
jgi:hypothetical protein